MSGTTRGDHPAGRGLLRTNNDLLMRLIALGFTPDHERSTSDISAWGYEGIEGTLLLPALNSMSAPCSASAVSRASSHIGLSIHQFWTAPILLVITPEEEAPLSAEEILDIIAPDRVRLAPELVAKWLSTTDEVIALANTASN